MTAGFDINDRATWAWTDETVHTGYAAVDDHYALHLRDPGAFYLLRDGVPKIQPLPPLGGGRVSGVQPHDRGL